MFILSVVSAERVCVEFFSFARGSIRDFIGVDTFGSGAFSVFLEVLQILIDNLFWSRAVELDIVYVMDGKSHIYCHTWGTALGGLLISQVRRFTKVS